MQVLRDKYSLDELIELEATRRGIDPKLIRGIVRTESSERPEAISHVGARGLMQLMPSTARGMGFTGPDAELHDPSINVALGVSYFKELLDRYNGDVAKALSAYNQGPGNLAKHGVEGESGNPGKYVEKVKGQSFKDGGKVGVFDRPVSPMRMKPGMDEADIEMIIERALSKVLGGQNFAGGGQVQTAQGMVDVQPGQRYAAVPGQPGVFALQPSGGGGGGASKVNKNPTGGVVGPKAGGSPVPGQKPAGQKKAKAPSQQPAPGQSATGGSLMGQVTNTANQLSNFNPLNAQSQNALQGIIGGQSKADVSGAANAAQIRGADEFNNLLAPQINEQMGAMGMGTSSAREAMLGREASRISQGIAATGMEAQIGADENALNRQLGAFNPALQASGQRLSGLNSAGGLQMGQAGLVSNERLAEKGLASQTQLQQAQLNQQAAMQNQQMAFQKAQLEAQMAMQAAMSGGGSYGGSGISTSNVAKGGTRSAAYGFEDGGEVPNFAKGGRLDEQDFLSNYLYGRQFNERSGNIIMPKFDKFDIDVPQFRRSSGGDSRYGSSGDVNRPSPYAMANARNQAQRDAAQAHERQLELMRQGQQLNPLDQYKLDIAKRLERLGGTTPSGSGFAEYKLTNELKSLLQTLSGGGASQGPSMSFEGVNRNPGAMVQQQRLAEFYKNAQIDPNTQQSTAPLSKVQKKEKGGQVDDGWDYMSMDEFDDGGLVEGRQTPPDRVRINAQGGEGILPLDVMDRLRTYKSKDPMIKEIQRLMDFEGDNLQTGGQVTKEDLERRQGKASYGSTTTSIPAAGGAVDPNAQALAALFELDPETLEIITNQLGTSIRDPQSKKLLPQEQFLKNYPGLVLPGMEGFAPGKVQFNRDPKTGKLSKVENKHGGGRVSCPPSQHLMPNHTCMDDSKMKKNYQTGGQLPTNSPRRMQVSAIPGYTFSNKELDTYQTPSSQGVSFETPDIDIDYEISQRNARRESENRRISLYESLGLTAGPAVRAKLAALAQQAMGLRDQEDEGIAQLMQLKGQQELAKGQQDIVKQQAADLSAYREGQLGLGQARLENSALANQIKALEKATGMSITDFIALAQQKTGTQEQ